jgi:hypothetical protein
MTSLWTPTTRQAQCEGLDHWHPQELTQHKSREKSEFEALCLPRLLIKRAWRLNGTGFWVQGTGVRGHILTHLKKATFSTCIGCESKQNLIVSAIK